MKNILWGLLAVVVLVAVIWIPIEGDLLLKKHFLPQYEGVRREVFEQSKAYNQGMIQELQNMQFEYIKADDAHKQALASIILHRCADYDENKLPYDLRMFIQQLKNGGFNK